MKTVFTNSNNMSVIFTDNGVIFHDARQSVYYPYGGIDTISMSFMGVLQVIHRAKICNFAVANKDRAEMKKMIKFVRDAKDTGPDGEPIYLKNNSLIAKMEVSEQLQYYKSQFVQGIISKEEYDVRKLLLRE